MDINPTTKQMARTLSILVEYAPHWLMAAEIADLLGKLDRPLNINTALSCAKIALFVETSGTRGQYDYRITKLGHGFLEAYNAIRDKEPTP